MKHCFNLKTISSLLVFSGVLSVQVGFAAEEEEPVFKNDEFSRLLGVFNKRLPGEYQAYCGNEDNRIWEKAGWISKNACLQDGRSHVVYKINWKGDPEEGFDKAHDLKILAEAVKDGAEISVSESSTHSTSNYKCARTIANPKQAHCSSHVFKWYHNKKHYENILKVNVHLAKSKQDTDKKSYEKMKSRINLAKSKQVWFMTDTNGLRQYNELYFNNPKATLTANIDGKKVAGKIDKQLVIKERISPMDGKGWVKSYSWHVRY